MKKLLPLIMILMAAPAANAGGLVHKMSSSVQLTVDTARSTATRLGNQYSISGSNVGTSDGTTAGMLTGGTISSGVYSPGTITANQLDATGGEAFSTSGIKLVCCDSSRSINSTTNSSTCQHSSSGSVRRSYVRT